MLLDIDGSAIQLHDDFTIRLDIGTAMSILELFLQIDERRLENLSLDQMLPKITAGTFDVHSALTCWMSTLIPTARPTEFVLQIGGVRLDLVCRRCSSPGFTAMHDAASASRESRMRKTTHRVDPDSKLTEDINNMLHNLALHFTEDPKALSTYATVLKDARRVCPILIPGEDRNTSNATVEAGAQGPAPASENQLELVKKLEVYREHLDDSISGTVLLLVGGIGVTVLVLGCFLCCRRCGARKRRRARTLSTLPEYHELQRMDDDDEDGLSLDALEVDDSEGMDSCRCDPLCCNRDISLGARLTVLLMLFCIIGLFLSGHLSIGSTVDIGLVIGGQQVELESFVEFSLGGSLIDMWRAGTYELAIFIGLFSGVWPYAKCLMMLTAWCLPSCCLSYKKRGQLLMTLDTLGKWSLIDLYVLAMTMLAFWVNIESPIRSYAPKPVYGVTLQCTPVWGLYAFVVAALLSLVANGIIMHFHRGHIERMKHEKTVAKQRGSAVASPLARLLRSISSSPRSSAASSRVSWVNAGTSDISGFRMGHVHQKEALRNHVFQLDSNRYTIAFRFGGQVVVTFMILGAGAFLLYGVLQDTFEFKINGIAGVIMDLGHPGSSHAQYSLATSALALAHQGKPHKFLGIYGAYGIAFTYLFVAAIAPLLNLLALAVMWVTPLTIKSQKKLFVISENLNAWSGTHVFLLAAVVALIELGQVSKFLIGRACDSLQPKLDALVEVGLLRDSQATCFAIDASLLFPGILYLLVSAILYVVVTQLITRAAEAAIEEREDRIKGISVPDVAHSQGCGKLFIFFVHKTCGCMSRVEGDALQEQLGLCANDPGMVAQINAALRATVSSSTYAAYESPKVSVPEEETPGWVECVYETFDDTSGNATHEAYFWNTLTGATQWESPDEGSLIHHGSPVLAPGPFASPTRSPARSSTRRNMTRRNSVSDEYVRKHPVPLDQPPSAGERILSPLETLNNSQLGLAPEPQSQGAITTDVERPGAVQFRDLDQFPTLSPPESLEPEPEPEPEPQSQGTIERGHV